MNFNEAFELLTSLYEGVSPENPYLAKALKLYKDDEQADGVIVSYRDGVTGKEIEVCRTYHGQDELHKINNEPGIKDSPDVSAIHSRSNIPYYEDELANKEKDTKNTEAQNTKDKLQADFDTKLTNALTNAGINTRELDREKYRKLQLNCIPKDVPADDADQRSIINQFIAILKKEFNLNKPIKSNTKYTTAQLTTMRQNNKKILTAVKNAGLDASKLTIRATNKNGKEFIKASPELNKMRKELFGESKKQN